MNLFDVISLIYRRMHFKLYALKLRLSGCNIIYGPHVEMEADAKIEFTSPNKNGFLYIGDYTYIGHLTKIALWEDASIRIGKYCCVSDLSQITARDDAAINIGDTAYFNRNVNILAAGTIDIGIKFSSGPNTLICDYDHKRIPNQHIAQKGSVSPQDVIGSVVIKDYVWIAGGATLLRGTELGNNSIVAAGAVVKGFVPDNTIYIDKTRMKPL